MEAILTTHEIQILLRSPLFRSISVEALDHWLRVSRPARRSFRRHETIFHQGEKTTELAIVLSGACNIEQNDVWGNRHIVGIVGEGDLFAETFAIIPNQAMRVSATALSDVCDCLFIPVDALICPAPCAGRIQSDDTLMAAVRQITQNNLLHILAMKNLRLTQKNELLNERTTRRKLLRYLSDLAAECQKTEFEIPFSRQELADFLGVDRSAMSTELTRLCKEGKLGVKGKRVWLNTTSED